MIYGIFLYLLVEYFIMIMYVEEQHDALMIYNLKNK
jgi:hypothetical protein